MLEHVVIGKVDPLFRNMLQVLKSLVAENRCPLVRDMF
jgi:hypothetical protein